MQYWVRVYLAFSITLSLDIIEGIKADSFILRRHQRSIELIILFVDKECISRVHLSCDSRVKWVAKYSEDILLVTIEVCTHNDEDTLINGESSISNIRFNMNDTKCEEWSIVNCQYVRQWSLFTTNPEGFSMLPWTCRLYHQLINSYELLPISV